jgi:ABC-type multidrug transport system ATPase subunit/pSer/pThr/pTyr-binding forkhead associated (FHA) protein/ABC-type multidrug transport system permease subunit
VSVTCARCGGPVAAGGPCAGCTPDAPGSAAATDLVLLADGGAEIVCRAPGPLVVGRSRGADVRLTDPTVSGRHATLTAGDGGWRLRDDGSSNGTLVNGTDAGDGHPVADGDVLHFGRARVEVRAAAAPAAGGPAGDRTVPGDVTPVHRRSEDLPKLLPLPEPGRPVTVGRSPGNTVALRDPSVSRHHVRLEADGEAVAVTDLDSLNGTYLNGEPVDRARMVPGDRLRVGRTVFAIDAPHAALAAARTSPVLEARGVGLSGRGGVTLLRDVSLRIAPGELVAILGPAGAGKSTLLNALCGVSAPDRGRITVAGEPLASMYTEIALVPQDDILHWDLTPREALTAAAGLRLPPDHSRAEVREIVDGLLDDLDLHGCADRPITMASGGQRKRVSVATELLGRPRLVFLDEPGAGLDAAHDRDLMDLCRRLADGGRAVVLTTHNTWHVDRCDRLLLVGRGGVLRYDGPPAEVLAAFGVDTLTEVYDALDVPAADRPPAAEEPPEPAGPARVAGPRRRVRARHVRTLARRNVILAVRDARSLGILVGGAPAMAALAVLVFGRDALTNAGTLDVRSVHLLLALSLIATWLGAFTGLRAFVSELRPWRREYALGVAPGATLIAKWIVLGAVVAAQGALIAATFVLLLRVDLPARTVAGVAGTLVLSGLAGLSAGLLISAAARNEARAVSAVLPYVVLQFFFAGVVVSQSAMGALGAVTWLASARWTVAGLGSLGGLVPAAQDLADTPPVRGEAPSEAVAAATEFLDTYGTGFFGASPPVYAGALLALTAACAALTLVVLRRSARRPA